MSALSARTAAPHTTSPAVRAQSVSRVSFALTATLVGTLAFVSCFFRLFIFPHTPLLPAGDAVGFFVAGSRIVAGELPYRDFFEILPVASDLAYASLIKLFGFYAWIPGMTMACLAAGIVLLTTLAARRFVSGIALALPGLLFTGIALSSETLNATHHWFCTLAVMAAMFALLDGTSSVRVAAAGALAGLAASFTQTSGATVVAALAIYVFWKARDESPNRHWHKPLLLIGSAFAMFVAVNGYFIWRAGLRAWLYSMFVFPVRYFGVPDFNNWRVITLDFRIHPSVERWLFFPFIYGLAVLVVIVLATIVRRLREHDSTEQWDDLLLVALTGAGMLLAVAPAPSLLRLSSASPPGLILLAWLLQRAGKPPRVPRFALAAAASAIAILVPLQHQFRWHIALRLPGGNIAFFDRAQYDEYRWLAGETTSGEYLFGAPAMHVALHTVNPAAVALFDTSDYTRPEQVTAGVQALAHAHVPFIILKHSFDEPALSATDHTQPLRDFLRTNYSIVKTFATGDAVWQATDQSKSQP
ncbi:MAG TPA: hypothetical protein VIY69_05855 [Candidatus Acidoferrales bacterium]